LEKETIMFRTRLRSSITHIGQALREPEGFAVHWYQEGAPYSWWVFLALASTSIIGTTTYGMAMGILGGGPRMFACGLKFTVAAGIAWSLPLPALYILNSLSGSRLRASTTFLAALVTTSWGGLAMIASIPITWFFIVAVSGAYQALVVVLVNLVVFAGVGVAMIDVFSRVIERLEPSRGKSPAWWLLLVGAIGAELFYAFGLFDLAVLAKPLSWFALL
jgi:hypothetical protein